MTKNETIELMKMILWSYPNFEVEPGKINWWHENIEEMSFGDVKTNLKKHISRSNYQPTIHDIKGEQQLSAKERLLGGRRFVV